MKHKKRRVLPKLFLLMILLCAVILIDSNFRIVTTEYEMVFNTLPDGFDGFRIAALSDIHAAEFGENNEVLIEKVRAAKPDIIAITGDLVDSYDKVPLDRQLEIADRLVSELVKIAPVYYITGNHEWDGGGARPLLEIIKNNGALALRNSYVRLELEDSAIIIAGTDDPNGPYDMIKPADFAEKIFEEQGGVFVVILEHRNNHLPLYSSVGIDLVICGHAHGGIVRLPFTDGLIGPSREWFPSNTNGVYEMAATKMLVSRGIGNHTGFPRVLNNPHIAVAVLRTG